MVTMKRKIVEGITVKRVRSERWIYEQRSDILLNWRYIRGKFGYKRCTKGRAKIRRNPYETMV